MARYKLFNIALLTTMLTSSSNGGLSEHSTNQEQKLDTISIFDRTLYACQNRAAEITASAEENLNVICTIENPHHSKLESIPEWYRPAEENVMKIFNETGQSTHSFTCQSYSRSAFCPIPDNLRNAKTYNYD